MSTLDDLLGGSPKLPSPAPDRAEQTDAPDEEVRLHPGLFRKPVGITFLAQVLGKQPYQINSRLARCPVKEWTQHKGKDTPKYDFLEAMAYLVQPKGNIEEWFAGKNAASLPPYVNKMFWDSAHQRNRVMRSSNDLWHTEDVRAVLGRVAMTIKSATREWVEALPGKELLSTGQYNAIVDETNSLLLDIQKALVDFAGDDPETSPMSRTIEAELEQGGGMPGEDLGADEGGDE